MDPSTPGSHLRDPADTIALVAAAFGLTPEQLRLGRRTRHILTARRVAAMLLHDTGWYSYADVARLLDYAHHSSVLDTVKVLRQRLTTDARLWAIVEGLRVQLGIPYPGGE